MGEGWGEGILLRYDSRAISEVVHAPARLPLLAVTAIAAVPRLFDALKRPIDYNGWWHVFIARNLSREWLNLQHPPLFIALLRIVDSVGHSALAYRSISLASGIGSVYLVGLLLARLDCLPETQVLGALTAALAYNAITLSNEVESYSLAVLLILGAFFFYLDVIAVRAPPVRSRVVFAGLSCLAVATHYFAGLFLIACVLAPLAIAAVSPEYRRRLFADASRRRLADLFTFLPPAAVGLALYQLQAKPWVTRLSSLPAFYYHPGEERVVNFAIRNLRETWNLFAPFSFLHARCALPLLGLFLAGVIWGATRRFPNGDASPRRIVPSLFLVELLGIGIALGSLGKYPFGGMMRHQFLFFLFALLAGCVALDSSLRNLGAPGTRRVAVAACFAAIALDFGFQLPRLASPRRYPLPPIVRQFSSEFESAGAVTVDYFNLIGLFSVYPDREWRFLGRDPYRATVERYEVGGGSRVLEVLAVRDFWVFDFGDEALYRELAEVWPRDARVCHFVFCATGTVLYEPRWNSMAGRRELLRTRMAALANRHGLAVKQCRATEYLDLLVELCGSRSPPLAR
jgi:hypothetical protein